jgi:hypothetical protein
VDRVTALVISRMSSTVTGTVLEYPRTTLPEESPTSSTGMPASSNTEALTVSYAVSIAHFSPRSLACCRWCTRTRVLDWPP